MLGSWGLALHGASFSTWFGNPIGWLAGVVFGAALILAGRSRRLSVGAIAISVAALAATLITPGQSGVHRWLDLGPLQVNIAALVLPITVVSIATLSLAPAVLLAIIGLIGVILVAQPDASQASTFLIAAAIILVRSRLPFIPLVCGLFGAAALVTCAWTRPDPLQPIAEVEGVLPLLAGDSGALAAAAALGLAITCLVPLLRQSSRDAAGGRAAEALSVYFAATAVMPFLGAYPVPLVGAGMSFPLGLWLAMAWLCARTDQPIQ